MNNNIMSVLAMANTTVSTEVDSTNIYGVPPIRDGGTPPEATSLAAGDAADTADINNNSAEVYYSKEGCCLRVLAAMCFGLLDEGTPVFDVEQYPWKTVPTSKIRPNREQYSRELCQRLARKASAAANPKVCPRPSGWNLPKIQKWLMENAVDDDVDVAFLKNTVAERKALVIAAEKEAAEENNRLSVAGNWNATACMRLIHTLIDDNDNNNNIIKSKFLNRLILPAGRASVENREQIRATDVWHLMADRWNNQDFEPETESLPDLHPDFAVSDTIFYFDVASLTPATAGKVEEKWASMILEMNRCIGNWQKSGQGEGGIYDADNAADHEFGSLENRSQHALASQKDFFRGSQTYLLYLWQMLNNHGLLGSALQRLNNSVSSANGASGVPSVICTRLSAGDCDSMGEDASHSTTTRGNSDMASLGHSIENHGQSLINIAKMELQHKEKIAKMQADENEKERIHRDQVEMRNRIQQLSGEKRTLLLQYAAETQKKNKFMVDAIMEQIHDLEKVIKNKTKELSSSENTPKKNNQTP